MDNTNWKEFKIEDLFSIKRGDIASQNSLIEDKQGIAFIAQNNGNNGFVKYVLEQDYKKFGKAIIIGRQTGVSYYMDEEFVTTDGVLVLNPIDFDINKERGLFITSIIKKHLSLFGYSNTVSAEKLRGITVKLPSTPDGTPDYEFMADHVRRIQADHVRRIQVYLEATGLSDTVLTEEEERALNLDVQWREFNLGGLLTFKAIKQAKSQKNIPSDYTEDGISYIVQSVSNNMVSRKVNKQWLINNNEPPVSGNKIALGVTLPAVSYQSDEFGASQIIIGEAGWLNKYTGVYIATVLSKMMYRFSYGSKPGLQIYKDMLIKLPSTPDGTPDFAFIETYIRATQKRVIKNLVEWNAKELAAYQSVI
jgi:hypothetical protein